MLRMLSILAVFLGGFAGASVASDPDYFSGERVKTTSREPVYNTRLHKRFALADEYEQGGAFYYRSNELNSFGMREVLNTEQELIFCSGGEKDFTDAMFRASTTSSSLAAYGDETVFTGEGVRADATTASFSPSSMESAIETTLLSNSGNARGRFCYKRTNAQVDFRNPDANEAVYCPEGGVKTIFDMASGETCTLELDINLRVGKTRYLRQLNGENSRTVSQGFLSCEEDIDGNPMLELVANPDGCTRGEGGQDACNNSCSWAKDVVCDPINMPRWGGGKCGGMGTVIFKDDVIEVNAHPNLSYDDESGSLYEGYATMSCQMVSGKAQWVVASNVCNERND